MSSQDCSNDPPVNDVMDAPSASRQSNILTAMKLVAASALFYSAGTSLATTVHHLKNDDAAVNNNAAAYGGRNSNNDNGMAAPSNNGYAYSPPRQVQHGRRLSSANSISKDSPPSYMKNLFDDLKERTKLMTETPADEVKYWFEYTGPLQVRRRCPCFRCRILCHSCCCVQLVCSLGRMKRPQFKA